MSRRYNALGVLTRVGGFCGGTPSKRGFNRLPPVGLARSDAKRDGDCPHCRLSYPYVEVANVCYASVDSFERHMRRW
jgi:hypothetical protein